MNQIRKYSLAASVVILLLCLFIPSSIAGYLATLVIGALLVTNPKSGLLFLTIYFPIRPFLIEINDSLKYIGDFVVVLLFFYAVWLWVKNKRRFGKESIFIIGFIAFCLIGAISALITGVLPIAIIFQYRAFLITFLLVFIVGNLDITKKDITQFLWTTVIMAVILCLQGIVEKVSLRTLLIPQAWQEVWMPETNRIRIYSLVGNPNVLATYLSIAFIFTLFLRATYTKYRILLNICSILIFGVFILTYSRGTILGLVVGYLVYLLISRNWKSVKAIAISVVLSLPLVYYPVIMATDYMEQSKAETATEQEEEKPADKDSNVTEKEKNEFTQRMTETFDKTHLEKSADWGRLYILKLGFEIFKEHPIIGTGFGTYGDSASLTYSSPIYDEYKITTEIYSDNQYIQIITQTGILGVISFAVFIIGMGVLLWKKRKEINLANPLIAILIGGFVAGLIYNIWEDKTFTLYFYILLGYILNRGYWNKRHFE